MLYLIMRYRQWSLSNIIALIFICIAMSLYMTPSEPKNIIANIIFTSLAVAAIFRNRLSYSFILIGIRPVALLLLLFAYGLIQSFALQHSDSSLYFLFLLIAFIPYISMFLICSNLKPNQVNFFILIIFIIPGIIHLIYMYLDIGIAFQDGSLLFPTQSRFGLLEHIKETPRVGRRYLSIALLHLLSGGILMAWIYRGSPVKYYGIGFVFISAISLALLDTRAAYLSFMLGAICLAIACRFRWILQIVRRIQPLIKPQRLAYASCLLIIFTALAFNAGKSRWLSFDYSVRAAIYDVSDSTVVLAERRYIDASYWEKPIADIDKCYQYQHFRCQVDQSAYLRAAWFLEGLQSLRKHPFGIGYSSDYMARLWELPTASHIYKHTDSFLIECIISFGIFSILIYVYFLYQLIRTLRRFNSITMPIILITLVLLSCIIRSSIDVFSFGLWSYFMAFLGMYYGLANVNVNVNVNVDYAGK